MGCQTNNATPPGPAIAPGAELLDPRHIAAELGARAGGPIDPRIPALVPGFDAPFFQAGLAGYSDAAMRLIARRHGCPFCVTEALLDRTLLAGGRGFVKADLGELHDNIPGGLDDHPLAGQIMGSEPAEMAAAALKMVEQRARSERDYRRLAYHGALGPGAATTLPIGTRSVSEGADEPSPIRARSASEGTREPSHQPLRLPGGEQIGWISCGDEGDDQEGIEAPRHHGIDAAEHPHTQSDRTYTSHTADPARTAGASFEVIDVNLACPVKKIEKKARGGHWLTEPKGAIDILEAVREALPANVVCSVKLRRSFDDSPAMIENFHRIFEAAYDLGYAWTTVHARTVEQKYVGPSRWDFLRDLVRRHPDKIIFGSGDVWNVGDIFRMIRYTGVKAVSVARGCIGNPWIFRQARQMLAGQAPVPPTIAEQRRVLEDHYALLLRVCRGMRDGEESASKMIRKFGIRFSEHHPRREEVRQRMIAVSRVEDWEAILRECYDAEREAGLATEPV